MKVTTTTTNKNNIVYKVTTGDRKSIISNWNNTPEEHRLIQELIISYPVLKWAYPRIEGAYILAFKTLEAARTFVNVELGYRGLACDYNSGLIIWKALSDNQIEYKKYENALPSLDDLESYKEKLKPENKNQNYFSFPVGTVYCNRIRLVKKLETKYYAPSTT